MKRFFFLQVILLILVSCNTIPEENRVLLAEDSESIAVYSITKAGCKNCQKVIESGLNSLVGIEQSILNLHTKEVSIVYQPNLIPSELLDKKVKALEGIIPCK